MSIKSAVDSRRSSNQAHLDPSADIGNCLRWKMLLQLDASGMDETVEKIEAPAAYRLLFLVHASADAAGSAGGREST